LDFLVREEVMETLVLVFDAPALDLDLERIALSLRVLGTIRVDHRQLSVEKGDASAYLKPLTDSEGEIFSDWPVKLIPSGAQIFSLDYRSTALARTIVCALDVEYRFLIDTNYGAVLRSDEFCRLAAESTWTWERWP
jgi:hypothetical protein